MDRQTGILKKTQFVRFIFDVIILDSIEANVERAQNNVEGANLQLGKASRYQVRQGWYEVSLTVMFFVIILGVHHVNFKRILTK